jgi:hypothetical protein
MRSFVLAVTLFSLVGCSRGPEPTTTAPAAVTAPSSSAVALVSTPSSLTLHNSQQAICPLRWTCDNIHWFSTQAACTSSCGPDCYQDARCTLGCVCP